MIRKPTYLFLVILFLWKCAPQEKKASEQTNPDSLSIKSDADTIESITTIIPLDTIVANYSSGQKLYLYILAYHDSLPGRPIKDFEVRDAEKNETVFRSITKQLKLGYETDPMKEEYDSLFVVPTYTISSRYPLTIDLNFSVEGGFTSAFLGDITYPFYEKTSWLNFLRYTFVNDKSWKVKSALQFIPQKCSVTEPELITRFNENKKAGKYFTDNREQFIKLSFTCFLNNANPHYEMIKEEFINALGETYFPDGYYVYVIYLDKFILNLIY